MVAITDQAREALESWAREQEASGLFVRVVMAGYG
jgi:hypothetical protein